jgi:hypothetical protein
VRVLEHPSFERRLFLSGFDFRGRRNHCTFGFALDACPFKVTGFFGSIDVSGSGDADGFSFSFQGVAFARPARPWVDSKRRQDTECGLQLHFDKNAGSL